METSLQNGEIRETKITIKPLLFDIIFLLNIYRKNIYFI